MPDTPDTTPTGAPLTETQAEALAHTADAAAPGQDESGRTFVAAIAVVAVTLVLIGAPFFIFDGLNDADLAAQRTLDSTKTALQVEQDSIAARLARGGAVRDTAGRVVGLTLPIDSAIARVATAPTGSASDALTAR